MYEVRINGTNHAHTCHAADHRAAARAALAVAADAGFSPASGQRISVINNETTVQFDVDAVGRLREMSRYTAAYRPYWQ